MERPPADEGVVSATLITPMVTECNVPGEVIDYELMKVIQNVFGISDNTFQYKEVQYSWMQVRKLCAGLTLLYLFQVLVEKVMWNLHAMLSRPWQHLLMSNLKRSTWILLTKLYLTST